MVLFVLLLAIILVSKIKQVSSALELWLCMSVGMCCSYTCVILGTEPRFSDMLSTWYSTELHIQPYAFMICSTGLEPKASCILAKFSTSELWHQPLAFIFNNRIRRHLGIVYIKGIGVSPS